MKKAPMSFVKFSIGTNTKTIYTSKDEVSKSSEKNLIVVGGNQLFQRGETKTEGIENTFSDGVIFPSRILSKGKNFELSFYAFGESSAALEALNSLQNFLWSGKSNVTLGTKFEKTIEGVIPESVNVEEEASFSEDKTIIKFSVVFRSEKASFK